MYGLDISFPTHSKLNKNELLLMKNLEIEIWRNCCSPEGHSPFGHARGTAADIKVYNLDNNVCTVKKSRSHAERTERSFS